MPILAMIGTNEFVHLFTGPSFLLLANQVRALTQALNHKLMTLCPEIDVLDVVGGSLEVASGVVTLGDEDVVVNAALEWLIQWDWGSLKGISCVFCQTSEQHTMNFSSILPRRSKPGASSRWWFALVSAIVETMAM